MSNHHHIYGKCTLGLVTVISLFLSTGHAAGQADVGLSPMKVEFPGVAGRSYSGSLSLTNSGTEKVRIRVEMNDFYVDESTTPQFVANAATESNFSCRNWLGANPMELEIEGKRAVPVRYTVHVPTSASERSYHCALSFRTLPAAGEGSGTSMRIAVRLITVFYATLGKPQVTGVIKELKLEQVAGADGPVWRAVVVMENSGLVLFRPIGELTVVNASGTAIETQKIPSFPALPQRLQRYLIPLKTNLAPGQYTLRASIEVGSEIQQASVAVTATEPAPTEH